MFHCLWKNREYVFLEEQVISDQCKEIEGNNRMGKTRDVFKKIRDTQGTFHAKMGTIRGRNSVHLTEAEENNTTSTFLLGLRKHH